MVTAVKAGAIVPPADIRFLRLGANPQHGETPASRIISFLQNVYESVAETLPDARKEEHDCKTTLTECGSEQDQDPYATAFMDGVAVPIKPRHKPSSCRGARRQVAPTRGPREGLLGANVFTRASSELLPVLARHPEAF